MSKQPNKQPNVAFLTPVEGGISLEGSENWKAADIPHSLGSYHSLWAIRECDLLRLFSSNIAAYTSVADASERTGIQVRPAVPAPIAEADEPETWILDVSDIGSVVEASFKLAAQQAKHFRGLGHHVVIRRADAKGNHLQTHIKPVLMRWDKLYPGYFWAYLVDEKGGNDPELVKVSRFDADHLSIEIDGVVHILSEEWRFYQYLPYEPFDRSEVRFQVGD